MQGPDLRLIISQVRRERALHIVLYQVSERQRKAKVSTARKMPVRLDKYAD